MLERAHLADGAELITEVAEAERVLADLVFELGRIGAVDDFFRLLDERQHVAHAEQARDEPVGVEGFEILEPLAGADKGDGHADDSDHRQGRAAAGVAVDLREDDAADADLPVELAGALDRVLAGHRIGDVEQIRGLDRVLDGDQLAHQLVVDVQAAGGVDDDHVAAGVPRFDEGAAGARERVEIAGRIVDAHAGLGADDGELFDGGRTADVGGDDDRVPALPGQHPGQLAGGRGLARPLEAEHQDDLGHRPADAQPALGVAEQAEQFVADDLDDVLTGAEAGLDGRVAGLVADPIDKRLDHLEVDVGLDQGHADLAQHAFGRLRGEADLAAQRLENVLESGAQGVEHGSGAADGTRHKPLFYLRF